MSEIILITGGTGFAGSHLVEFLLNDQQIDPKQIHVTTYASTNTVVNGLLPESHIHALNLTDEEATKELLTRIKPTQIYHLAAIAAVGNSFDSPSKVLTINLQLQVSLLEAIRQIVPSARTLIVGSAQEYDVISSPALAAISETHPLGPANPYGVSKVDQDLLALSYHYSYDLQILRVRPFNHIGERQTPDFAIPAFAKQIVEEEKSQLDRGSITVGNLSAIRDFTDVKDMVKAYHTVMEKGQVGDVYNIGSGQGYVIDDLLNMLISGARKPIDVLSDPKKFRPLDVSKIIADSTKIRALGWQPNYAISDTLERVLTYWRNTL